MRAFVSLVIQRCVDFSAFDFFGHLCYNTCNIETATGQDKNEKRRKKSKGPYEIHITALNDYLSQQTFQLKAIVQEDMYYVNKLKSRNGEFRNRLKDEIERCRIENIIPGHDQDVFLH